MARFNDNYGSYTTGAGVPTGWTQRYNTATVAYSIVDDAGSPGGKYLEIAKSGAGRSLITLDAADGDDQGALFCIEFETGGAPGIYIHASGTDSTPGAYWVELVESTNNIGLWEGNGAGGFTNHDNDTSLTLTAGTKYWVRIQRFEPSNKIKARVWADGTDEPTTWNVEATDSSHTTGWVGVSELANGKTTKVHYASCATDFDTGCTVEDADFPAVGAYYISLQDDSLRLMHQDASENFVVRLFDEGDDPKDVCWHKVKEQPYVSLGGVGEINRYDRYGNNETSIVSAITNVFGITFDYDNNLMYYTNREAVSELFKNSEDGGSHSQIATSITWAAQPFFNESDGFVYVAYENGVRSYNSAGTLQTDYNGLTQIHAVAVDATNVMCGSWNNAGIWYQPIGGGSWTNADSTYNVWQMSLSRDLSEVWGAAFNDDLIVKWDSLPPPASGNRSVVDSGNEFDAIHAIALADLTPPTFVVTSATPPEGVVGASIVIAGEGFDDTTNVRFNGTEASFVVDNDFQITATVPSGATDGPIEVEIPSGIATSSFDFKVLPTLPGDGWNIELFQIQVNVGETDIELVSGTYRQYYTEGLVDDLDFIPISISNLEESVEWDEGVFRLGSVDMTVAKLEADYFNSYRTYVTSPYVLVIRDSNDNILFHGPVDPETCQYNAKNRHTTIRALSWEVLLEGTSAPCRSIFETTFSRDYSDALATGINSTMYVKKTINGTDMTTVVVAGSVLVFDTPAGEHRSIVLGHTVDGDDLAVLVNTEPTVYLATNKSVLGSEHEVFQVGSGGLSFRRLRMTFQDAQIWENLNAAEDGVSDLVLTVDVNGKNYTMPMTDAIDTSAAWYNLDEDRITIEILFNVCSGTCNPITLETDFIDFGSSISITSNTTVKTGDAVRILGAELYGYNNTGAAFAPILHFQINGGVLQGMFSLADLGVLPYIIDTFVFPAGFDKRIDRWAELPPNLLDALHQIQNTHGLLLRITPTIGPGGLPRGTVTIRDRGDANTTDSPVVSSITDIIEWNEAAADLTPTAVVVKAHINYFEPVGRVEDVGFYFDGLDLLDPQTTGKPQNGRVVEITVNTTPSYTGDVFFGDGIPVRNDDKLKEIAKKFYEYYRALSRPCQFKIEGTPQEDLLTKIISISEVDDPLTGSTFTRTLFCEGVITDLNTNQSIIRGRIGEFTGLTGQDPVPVITGQIIYTDADDSGDEDVILSGLNSYDPQGDDITYEWKEGATSLSTAPVLEHTFATGDHTITLEVTDSGSNMASTSVTVQVKESSEDLPTGDPVQANFVVQSYSINQDGDVFITVTGDGNTQTTDGIVYRVADTQAGLDSAGDNEVDNPQIALEIISALTTNATKWVRISLINVVDGSTSSNVWEFAVTNTGATTALIIPSNTAPTSSADAAGVDGELRADGSYLYYKDSTNGWIRSALSTF